MGLRIARHLNNLRVKLAGILLASLLLASGPVWAGIPGATGMEVSPADPPAPAPNITLPTISGGAESLYALRGRVVLLHFWASWCPPCREELPDLVAVAAHYRNQGLTLLAVDADGTDASGAASFATANGINLPIAIDKDGTAHNEYGVRALPTTYLIDRKGNIVGRIVGSRDWTSPAARRLIKGLLAPKPGPKPLRSVQNLVSQQ